MSAKVTNAVLVSPVIRFWEANKRSERGSQEIADLHHMEDSSMARVWKSLLPRSEEYKTLLSFKAKLRSFIYANTLPAFRDGERLLPTTNYKAFTEGVRQLKNDFMFAVQEFCEVYPDLVEKARERLNGLYEEKDYPTADIVKAKFDVDVMFSPVPASEHFFEVELEDAQIDEIRKQHADEVARVMQGANKELWWRLHDAVNAIAGSLQKPNGRVLDATLENLDELLDVMSRLNVTGDKNLETLMQKTKERLVSLDTESLKKGAPERSIAAQDATDIVKAMSAFMGA